MQLVKNPQLSEKFPKKDILQFMVEMLVLSFHCCFFLLKKQTNKQKPVIVHLTKMIVGRSIQFIIYVAKFMFSTLKKIKLKLLNVR